VRADAVLEDAVENLVDGVLFNTGQCCCGIERIYVHSSVYDQFVDRFVALVKVLQRGSSFYGSRRHW
jgi:acyl-CoA reductase-like NAD-dependent aldehyde dehydrogenase